jgi:PAS domain S-box/PAS domain S-box/diguanylate cyclase (GGDEF) domain
MGKNTKSHTSSGANIETSKEETRELPQMLDIYRILVEAASDSIYMVDSQCRFIYVNPRYCSRLGLPLKNIIGKTYGNFHSREDTKSFATDVAEVFQKGLSFQREYRSQRDGSEFLRTFSPVRQSADKDAITAASIIAKNITEWRKKEDTLRQSEERFRTIIDTIADAYYEVDLAGNTTMFNDAYLKLYEYSAKEMQGKNYRTYVDKEKAEMAFWVFNHVFKTGNSTKKMEWEVITKSGTKKQVELSVSLIRDAQGKPLGFRGIISDITERRKSEETIRHQAFHDPLTGLANRILFYDRMNMAFNLARREKKMVAVIILDLDYFKEINDSRGHTVGDELLKSVSERLSQMVRASDTVSRYGGDEFTLIMPSLSNEKDALRIAQKIVKAFNEPFHLNVGDLTVTASIGVAMYPLHGQDIDTLMNKADAAMYLAKAMGRNRYFGYGTSDENS